jgi:ADP-ribose pyrophosphatase YjhB (NUDIX family)
MWIGGVRVVIPDEEGKILMVKQCHEGKEIWMVPGGGIEEGENAAEAAVREVFEETGLEIRISRLLWHVEEVSETRGQRFVNFFLAEKTGGVLALGADPEFDKDNQVLREARFLSKKEILALERVYPECLKTELWEALEPKYYPNNVFKIRK